MANARTGIGRWGRGGVGGVETQGADPGRSVGGGDVLLRPRFGERTRLEKPVLVHPYGEILACVPKTYRGRGEAKRYVRGVKM